MPEAVRVGAGALLLAVLLAGCATHTVWSIPDTRESNIRQEHRLTLQLWAIAQGQDLILRTPDGTWTRRFPGQRLEEVQRLVITAWPTGPQVHLLDTLHHATLGMVTAPPDPDLVVQEVAIATTVLELDHQPSSPGAQRVGQVLITPVAVALDGLLLPVLALGDPQVAVAVLRVLTP